MSRGRSSYVGAVPILVAVDCIILGFDHEGLKLLLFRRKIKPYQGEWSTIGSFVRPEESVESAAARVLESHTGLENIFMEPLGHYGAVDRDPGARVISLPYFALIRLGKEEINTTLTHQANWFDINAIPPLILDHNQMVAAALKELRRKARYRPIGFELLPEKFTIPQLQQLYETIYNKALDNRNFRKKILSMKILERLPEKDKSTSRKGAFLYSFIPKRYEQMVEKGVDFVL